MKQIINNCSSVVFLFFAFSLIISLAGYTKGNKAPVYAARAQMFDRFGKLVGTIDFSEDKNGVNLNVNIDRLKPGKYGIHFHEVGKCEGPTFETAGGHFNPGGKQHGFKNSEGPHAGDLPNLVVANPGSAKTKLED